MGRAAPREVVAGEPATEAGANLSLLYNNNNKDPDTTSAATKAIYN